MARNIYLYSDQVHDPDCELNSDFDKLIKAILNGHFVESSRLLGEGMSADIEEIARYFSQSAESDKELSETRCQAWRAASSQ